MSGLRSSFKKNGLLLHAVAALLFALFGFLSGVGPGWIRYAAGMRLNDAIEHARDPLPVLAERPDLCPPPEIGALVAELNESTSVEDLSATVPAEEMDALSKKWSEAEAHQIPEGVQTLLSEQRPLTSAAIHSEFANLAYLDRLEHWAALVQHATADEFPALLDGAIREPFVYPVCEATILSAIARRWAQLDPGGAFVAFRLPLPTILRSMEHKAQIVVAEEWILLDPDAALTAIRAVQIQSHRDALFGVIAPIVADPFTLFDDTFDQEAKDRLVTRAAMINPLRFIDAAKTGSFLPEAIVAAFEILAEQDPHATIARAELLPAQVQRNAALSGIASGWGKASPEASLEWSDTIEPRWRRAEAKARILKQWILSAPAEASQHLDHHCDYTTRLQLLPLLANTWAKLDEPAARNWIEHTLIGKAQTTAFRGYLRLPETKGDEDDR